MRVAVTGNSGQVSRSLQELAERRPKFQLIAVGRPELELTEPDSVRRALTEARPDLVVSAAAYTAVDRAEEEPERARAVNVEGARAVAETTASLGIPVIHLSTDYVFSGDGEVPWTEEDEPDPRGVYGRTKLAGERAVAAGNPRHVILRTAWIYSPFGKNFVKTMLRLAAERETIPVVSDQWGNPTLALDLAEGILHLASRLVEDEDFADYGIFHLTGSGSTNWSGLARHVLAVSQALGGPSAEVEEISSADFPTRARRPRNSRLSNEKCARIFGWWAPEWQPSSADVVRRILG